MSGFGWDYPPGVTGREPEIAGREEFETACGHNHIKCPECDTVYCDTVDSALCPVCKEDDDGD